MPSLFDELEKSAVLDILIVIGLDIHRRQTGEKRRKLIGDFAPGKNNEAHIKGIGLYDSLYKKTMSEKADIAITSDFLCFLAVLAPGGRGLPPLHPEYWGTSARI